MDKSNDKPKQNCQICKKKFGGVFSNEHQCKRCQRTVCKQCCTKKKSIFTKANFKMQEHRCCDLCWPESEYINNYAKQVNPLVFNNLSKQGKEWSELADISISQQKSNTKSKVKVQPVSFMDIWAQLTPSLRQLVGILIIKIPITTIQGTVKSVCDKVSISSNTGESATILILYLLCLTDQLNAIKIFNYLMNIAQNVNEKSICLNIQILCKQQQPNMEQKLIRNLCNYSKNINKGLTTVFFLNCLQIEIVHHLILQTLLSGDSQILQLSVSCLVYQFKNQILSGRQNEKSLRNLMWQTVILKNFQKSIKKLRKNIFRSNAIKSNKNENNQHLKQKQQAFQKKPTSTKLSLQLNEQKIQQIYNGKVAGNENEQAILTKLSEAEQFIKKMQSGELDDESINPKDFESLQKYLDLIIDQNQKSLKECQQFDKLLGSIQQQLYQRKQDRTVNKIDENAFRYSQEGEN